MQRIKHWVTHYGSAPHCQLLQAAHVDDVSLHLPVLLCCAVPQGALVFGEQLTLFTLAGGVLIFAGVLLVAVRTRTSDNSSSSGKAPAAGTISSTASMQSAEDADAAVPLKAFDRHHHQQQQQQAEGPDTASRDADQVQKLTAAAAPVAAQTADVELGVRQQVQHPGSSSHAVGDGADDNQQQQQWLLQPLLSERPSGSSSFSGSFTSAGSVLQLQGR